MKIQAFEMTQAAMYLRQGLTLLDARTVWVRGQMVLAMEFEGETAEAVQGEWNSPEVPIVVIADYRRLILELAKKAGSQ